MAFEKNGTALMKKLLVSVSYKIQDNIETNIRSIGWNSVTDRVYGIVREIDNPVCLQLNTQIRNQLRFKLRKLEYYGRSF